VALRGDLPSGTGGGARLVYANELVAFIREHTGDHFHIEVAAYPEIHPQAESYDSDIASSRQVRRRRGQRHHPVLLQRRCLFLLPRPLRGDRHRQADLRRHHADHQLRQPGALLAQLRRRDPALDLPAPGGLRRRPESIRAFGIEVVTQLCETLLEAARRAFTSTP
jgi:methylenetetrahydrofolate reductase (NADPH)